MSVPDPQSIPASMPPEVTSEAQATLQRFAEAASKASRQMAADIDKAFRKGPPMPDYEEAAKDLMPGPYGRPIKSRDATTKAPRIQARRNKQKAARAARKRNRRQ